MGSLHIRVWEHILRLQGISIPTLLQRGWEKVTTWFKATERSYIYIAENFGQR
jgi:hypothetical protein